MFMGANRIAILSKGCMKLLLTCIILFLVKALLRYNSQTIHTIHPFKVHNLVGFNIFTELCNHNHNQF